MPSSAESKLRPLGYDVSTYESLTREGPIPTQPVPNGISIRQLESDQDWAQLMANQKRLGREEGRDPASHDPYLERRYQAQRARIGRGGGAWFGAFDGDILAGGMGMFCGNGLARYQSVETRSDYRRQGICAALLSHASHWAESATPAARQVIVTDADSDAGRLYARVGFRPTERLVDAILPGY